MKAFFQFFLVMLLGVVLMPPSMQAEDSLGNQPTFQYQQQPVKIQLDDFQQAGQPIPQFGQYSNVPINYGYPTKANNNALEYGIVGVVVVTLLTIVGVVVKADIKARNTVIKENTKAINNFSEVIIRMTTTFAALDKSIHQRFDGLEDKFQGLEEELRRHRP